MDILPAAGHCPPDFAGERGPVIAGRWAVYRLVITLAWL